MYVQVVRHSGKWRIALKRWWRHTAYVKEVDDLGLDFGHVCWDIVQFDDVDKAELEAQRYANRHRAKYIPRSRGEEGNKEKQAAVQVGCPNCNCGCNGI
ncbi:hypothetical protein VPHD148_0158 [Vibrio phage D148]